MRKSALVAAAVLAAAVAVVATGAAKPPPQSTGHVYVNDNTAGQNTVAGFDRNADGSLTPMAGPPSTSAVPAVGTGTPRRGRCS